MANVEDGSFRVKFIVDRARGPVVIDEDGARRYGDLGLGDDVMTEEDFLNTEISHTESYNRSIPTGYYGSPQDVVDELNAGIDKAIARAARNDNFAHLTLEQGFVFFHYDRTTDIVTCGSRENAPCRVRINLSSELFVKLGFGLSHDRVTSVSPPDRASHTADLDLGKNAIFVYSDILELNRLVGNKMLPLLAIVPYRGEHGKIMSHEPYSVEYCDPRYDSFDEIKIDLVGDTGEVLKFLSGKVFVTLHIKDKFA